LNTDQQLVVHLFAPTDGPRAESAYSALRELWLGCRQFFLMRDPLPHGDLPHQLPPSFRDLPGTAETGREAVLAAQERGDAECQAFLRRHHDVLNLSVVLATPDQSRWRDLDAQWSFLSSRLTVDMIGEARVYLARSAALPGPYLDELLPQPARIEYWNRDRAATDGRLSFWEAPPWTADRALRRLVLAFGDDKAEHDQASDWAWSDGGTAIPPLARYLLHTAKLRYLYRVWRRDTTAHELAAAIRSRTTEIRQASPGSEGNGALADELRDWAAEARLMTDDLRELRHATEIAEHSMGMAIVSAGHLTPTGLFADDRDLARSFLAGLDDELRYLDVAADRADETTTLVARRAAKAAEAAARDRAPVARPATDDITRNVFVVHGRDEAARLALFGFLEALGLHPLEWETLVTATHHASPYLRDVIMQGIAMAQAAVVLMTPDDVVSLHPSLRAADDDDHELKPGMQARPNVILELGMVLATYADRTIVLYAGKHRPVADLNGLNHVRLTGSGQCLDKVISRLRTAGCQVGDTPPSRQVRSRFTNLAAYQRDAP
jgi:predicted nucleotide-binding protein